MFARAKQLSRLTTALLGTLVWVSWVGGASAEDSFAMDDAAIADFPQSERRMMRFLSEAERRAIRHEHRKFWRRNGIESNRNSPYVYDHDHGARNSLRQFEFSPKERRDLRARLHQLPAEERKELRKKIRNMRELPEAEQKLLRERLHDMMSLSKDEQRAFRKNAGRWAEMPDERREKLRLQMRRLRALPADERLALLERLLDESQREPDESSEQ